MNEDIRGLLSCGVPTLELHLGEPPFDPAQKMADIDSLIAEQRQRRLVPGDAGTFRFSPKKLRKSARKAELRRRGY